VKPNSPPRRGEPTAALLRIVPALDALRGYRVADGRRDLLAGMTVACIAVPQAMAYALVAGIPVEFGLYTAIVMTAIGTLFSPSRQLVNGPTNAISIAVLSVIATVQVPDERLGTIFALTMLIGLIQLGITLARLGDLTRYVSHSVIVGFTLGAGSLLVFDQVKNLLGLRAMGDAHDHVLLRFWLTITQGGSVHLATAALGFGTIALILALRWLKRRMAWPLLPDLLIAVCAASLIVAWLDLDTAGVAVVGAIPASLPHFALPELDMAFVSSFGTGAFAIALLGLLEAISMAKALASRTREKLDMNQQCLSEALANIGGSAFQCMPGSGSLTRSAINQQAGGATQWSAMISAVGVAAIALVLAPYAQYLPKSSLAAILLVASHGMVDWRALASHWQATRFDATIVFVTAFSALAISIEFCVMIGVLMSFVLTVPRAGRMVLTEFVIGPHGRAHERLPGEERCSRLLIFGLEGEFFFGSSSTLEQHFATIAGLVGPDTRVIVLRMKRARNPDAVAADELEQFLSEMRSRGVHVLMCGVTPELHGVLERTGVLARVPEPLFLQQAVRESSTAHAIRHAYTLIDTRCAHCPWTGESRESGLAAAMPPGSL
jgi:SulP family sulfate permease